MLFEVGRQDRTSALQLLTIIKNKTYGGKFQTNTEVGTKLGNPA